MVKNHVLHTCTKRIEMACHFIYDQIKKGNFILEYVKSNDQNVDVFTKAMNKVWSHELKSWLQLRTCQ
jgi:hypothetical protein